MPFSSNILFLIKHNILFFQDIVNKKIRCYDLSQTLPKQLNKRVDKILKRSPSFLLESKLTLKEPPETDYDKERLMQQIDGQNKEMKNSDVHNFEETGDPDILDAEKKYKKFELKLEPPSSVMTSGNYEDDWSSGFLKKKIHERVKWQSKVHRLDKRITEKPIFVQADELIDIAAADFSDWINSLSSDSRSNITKELIKELFPIGLGGDATRALYVEPKQIRAIPDDVGQSWNLPHVYYINYLIFVYKKIKKFILQKIYFRCHLKGILLK